MRALVAVLNTFASIASLAMAGYGFLIIIMARYYDPLQIDYDAVAIGFVLLVTFLIIPTCCVIASSKMASRDRHLSILVALVPFALVVLAIFVIRAIPWPSPPSK